MQETKLEVLVGQKLQARNLVLVTAESCTGGLIGHLLTNVPGSSNYYWGGVISYDNRVKRNVLGVPAEVISTVGAVSEECALAMARGVLKLTGATVAVSVTGIAGPGGGSWDKPVGLVYIAVVDSQGYAKCERHVWNGDREQNKGQSAHRALEMVLEYLQ